MHSQKTLHERAVIQLEPEFSGSRFGLFPCPFSWAKVTEIGGSVCPQILEFQSFELDKNLNYARCQLNLYRSHNQP